MDERLARLDVNAPADPDSTEAVAVRLLFRARAAASAAGDHALYHEIGEWLRAHAGPWTIEQVMS